ncbi:MAG: hypothetical protein IJW59_03755 [Clostridia bacterium]|nr:hypothetical protein [Clostridia bacterium]
MFFGTDGIRGIVDKGIDSQLSYNIGKGIGIYCSENNIKNVLIGKDTRNSSDLIMYALITGIIDYGVNVTIIGIVPTPVISFIVEKQNFGMGIMITASHNDASYNGIKIFDSNGFKLSKNIEDIIEKKGFLSSLHKSTHKGHVRYDITLREQYINFLYEKFSTIKNRDIKVVVDCANGANYLIAPITYESLGIEVVRIASENNGDHINDNCGAEHIENLVNAVQKNGANLGIAFDGDGDRIRIVLNDGRVLTGDDLIYLFALYMKDTMKTNNMNIVGTIMTNEGLVESLKKKNINVLRSDVGDKNVIKVLKENKLSLGGEPSGHICLLEFNHSCDALLSSLLFLEIYFKCGLGFIEQINDINYYFSLIKNINIDSKLREDFDNNICIKKYLLELKNQYENCRIVLRPSGTEPVIRLYVESNSKSDCNKIAQKVLNFINNIIDT